MSEETIEDEECLLTRRLLLRPVRQTDAQAIATLANDRHIAEMTARIPHPYRLEDADAFIAGLGEERAFAVTLRERGTFIGVVGLQPRERAVTSFELGYWLGRPFWGEGYATEAAQAAIDKAFGALSAQCIEVRCRVVNAASRRIIQKCGFHYAGTGMDVSRTVGRVASETYRMDRRCWQSLKEWGGR
ncbi:GNAT family N-acetyltransferase [Aureimonas mangrovi]|uniref:GNAT family N-acetyltransferase n=1 Tax=Aureimonas mangrovi TaxID=2758041 RepID=UPI00163D6333|nr:GNAT family N-acetyltransferase [Aureimonas mangrovi]